MIITSLIIGLLVTFCAGFFLTPHVISYAHAIGLTDRPDGKLKRHAVPTAYLGGIAVCLPLLLSSFLWCQVHNVWALFFGCVALLVLGLCDDIYNLSPRTKTVGQVVVVLGWMCSGVCIQQVVLPSALFLPLNFLWMLTIINAFNLVDVRDGVTATVSLSTASVLFLCALATGQAELALLFICFMGSVAAFYWFNQPPARIYLGDAGSLFIGGFFAGTSMLLTWSSVYSWGFLAAPTILALPFFEVITLIGVRRYYRIPFYNGSPHHFVHFLERKGWSLYKIFIFIAAFIGVSGFVAMLFLQQLIPVVYWLPLGVVGYLFWLLIIFT